MTNRSSLYSSLAVCLMAAGVAGCSGASTSGSMGATPGGAQDNGLAQTQVNQGSVPKPEAFTVEGLLNQYDLPLESQACPLDQALCIDAAYGVAPAMVDNRSAVFVQIGFSSGIDAATFHRLPLNLSVVVDRSGSMSADSKLISVKQALNHLIDQLGEADRLSIVLFDDRVDVLAEPAAVTDKAKLKSLVSGISARNSTNMAAGLRQGSTFVQANAGQPGVSDRVMVFTDALTNTGDTDQSTFIQIAATNAAQNIGITLFGVGLDLNQELVLAITGMRGGNYFFLQDAAKIATVFDTDFDYLVTPLAYDLDFQLLPAEGFIITAVYGFPAWRTGSTTVAFNIPSVFLSRNHGAILVRLDPANHLWPAGQSPLAQLALSYSPVGGGLPVTQSLVAAYSGTAPLADDTIFYSQRAVRKSMALVNTSEGESKACQLYWSGSGDAATALLDRVQAMLTSEAATLEDADLTTEAKNVAKLENNMRSYYSGSTSTSGSSSSSSQNQPAPMACSFAGGSAGNPSALVGLLMLGVPALLRRRLPRRRKAGWLVTGDSAP